MVDVEDSDGQKFSAEFSSLIQSAYPVANFTTSGGVRASPGTPPMVPLIPEIDLINILTK